MRSRAARSALTAVLALATAAVGPARGQLTLALAPVADGLARPLIVTHAGDGSGRLFVGSQYGQIFIYREGAMLADPFLDIGPLVNCCGERGLLGLAFHPDFVSNQEFFVAHTDLEGTLAVARYRVSDENSDVADPGSRETLLEVPQPLANHNGGHLAFGPDGYLYVGVGDGGGAGDPQNNAQNLSNLLGALLRIDVDGVEPGLAYAVPADNPFLADTLARDEIWAYGLRNPWRFSFDRATGELWIGDVGQGSVEEIDLQPAAASGGQNYGWRRMEGSACYNPATGCNDGSLTLPVLEYSHAEGCSVTAGYRYRGSGLPGLRGTFLYGDFCTGTIWGTIPACGPALASRPLLASGRLISSFGEDEAGEIYVVGLGGTVDRLTLAPGSGGPALAASPGTLSFGALPLQVPKAMEITLTNLNPGPEAVRVEATTLSTPPFEVDFAAGSAPCGSAGPCLEPEGSCTLAIRFSADSAGLFEGTLSVTGNFAPVSVPLQAVGYANCPHPPTLDLHGLTIPDDQTFTACGTISTGPEFTVAGGGHARLVSGQAVVLSNGTTVAAQGSLSVVFDPLVAIP